MFALFTAAVSVLMSGPSPAARRSSTGANQATAEISGISFARVTIVAFVIFSVGLAIAGVLNGAGFGQATIQSLPA